MTAQRRFKTGNREAKETDESLLQRTRRGEALAFAELATRYWSAVHRIAWNMLPDPAAPAQVTEAAFLSVLRSRESFPAGVRFRTSLYRVAMGESWRRLRSISRSAPRSLGAYLPTFDAGGRWVAGRQETADADGSARAERFAEEPIREVLHRLDVLDRAAFVLREIEQLSLEEAAAILGIAPGSIRQRTHRTTLILVALLRRPQERAELRS